MPGAFCPMPRSEKILPLPNLEQRVRSCLCHYSRFATEDAESAHKPIATARMNEDSQVSPKPPVPRFRQAAHHAKPDPDMLDVQIGHKPPVPKQNSSLLRSIDDPDGTTSQPTIKGRHAIALLKIL